MRAERDSLRSGVREPETALQLPFNLGYDEIAEIHNDGFSKKFVKIARQAILVALKKEDDLQRAAASVVGYLRETRRSQNWLCSFSRASAENYMKCHQAGEVIFAFTANGIEYHAKINELDS